VLLWFKEIIEAARRADKAITKVFFSNETWAELNILVPYQWYHDANRLAELREEIEMENEGAVIPPF